eukprot:74502-Rhodomonas_salina.1
MSGTAVAYGAIRCAVLTWRSSTVRVYGAMRCAVLTWRIRCSNRPSQAGAIPITLHVACYAITLPVALLLHRPTRSMIPYHAVHDTISRNAL